MTPASLATARGGWPRFGGRGRGQVSGRVEDSGSLGPKYVSEENANAYLPLAGGDWDSEVRRCRRCTASVGLLDRWCWAVYCTSQDAENLHELKRYFPRLLASKLLLRDVDSDSLLVEYNQAR